MGILGKIDSTQPVKVWLQVILSFIPFVGIYPFLRIKKFKKMFAMNAVVVLIFIMYLLIKFDLANQLQQVLDAVKWLNYLVLPIVNAFFVWRWSTKYNQNLNQLSSNNDKI